MGQINTYPIVIKGRIVVLKGLKVGTSERYSPNRFTSGLELSENSFILSVVDTSVLFLHQVVVRQAATAATVGR